MSISVCIPTFNGQHYIEEQLRSILSQISSNDEIIISDDESKDNTLEIIKSINDNRIKVYIHKKQHTEKYPFMYVTRNMENALRHAKGDYIYLADQDDVWLPDKVNIVQASLEKNILVCSDCCVVDKSLNIIYNSYFALNHSKEGIIKNIIKNSYLGCCMAFKRELLNIILPIDVNNVPHDIWIGLIAELYGEVEFINDVLVQYRRHGENLSPSAEKNNVNSLWFKIRYRFIIAKAIIKRRIYEGFTTR